MLWVISSKRKKSEMTNPKYSNYIFVAMSVKGTAFEASHLLYTYPVMISVSHLEKKFLPMSLGQLFTGNLGHEI